MGSVQIVLITEQIAGELCQLKKLAWKIQVSVFLHEFDSLSNRSFYQVAEASRL